MAKPEQTPRPLDNAHWVLLNCKKPFVDAWQLPENKPSAQEVKNHLAQGKTVGIKPDSVGCVVIDIDVNEDKGENGEKGLAEVRALLDLDDDSSLALPSLTPGSYHLWCAAAANWPEGDEVWALEHAHGEIRYSSGQIAMHGGEVAIRRLDRWLRAEPWAIGLGEYQTLMAATAAKNAKTGAKTERKAGQFTYEQVRDAYLEIWEPHRETDKEICGPCPICKAGVDRFHIKRNDPILLGCRKCPNAKITAFFAALGLSAQAPADALVELASVGQGDSQPVLWLWHEFIPEGEITVLAGKGGAGKSTLALTFAAIVASGSAWPDGSKSKRGRVVIMSTEDDLAKVQRPRTQAALKERGAEHDHLPIDSVLWNAHASIADALLPLLQQLEDSGDPPALLIIDPLIEIMSRGNSNAANDVRRCLHPLQTFAARTGTAVLGVTHLAKYADEAAAVERVIGSSAWTTKPRALLLAHYDKQGGDSRKLLRAKANLGPEDGGYEYDLVINAQSISTVQFGEELVGDADKLTAPKKGALSAEEIRQGDSHFEELRALFAKPDAQRPDWAIFPSASFNAATRWDNRKLGQYRKLKGYETRRGGKHYPGWWWAEEVEEAESDL